MRSLSIFATRILFITVLCLSLDTARAQTYNGDRYRRPVAPTRNLIVMITDGTSFGVLSAARWYKGYAAGATRSAATAGSPRNPAGALAIDPYLCGTVRTFSSNAPIVDSAPAMSAFMTGMPQQSGNISVYPPADPGKDLVEVDTALAYRPLATILEAARIVGGKATGLVATVEFPHATPAACAAHCESRKRYDLIAPQMVAQNLDVMFAGGADNITDADKAHLAAKGIRYIEDDIRSFRTHDSGKIWSLWGNGHMPYDIDRDTARIPSLTEMTLKAIELLSQHENGFFLMVEGSKVDWGAHANDPAAIITEFVEFDRAVGAAMEFALRDGNTTVVVLPDHSTAGFTIGNYDLPDYSRASIGTIMGNLARFTRTSEGLEKILLAAGPERFREVFREYMGIELTDKEVEDLISGMGNKATDYMKVSAGNNMQAVISGIMNRRIYFGYTSGGHTGDEVFLAAHHPQGHIPQGMNTNIEINRYLSDALGLEKRLPQLTEEIFAPHTEVFKGYRCTVDKTKPDRPVLVVAKGHRRLEIAAFSSMARLNGRPFDIGSVAVYMDRTGCFYLPAGLAERLAK